MKKIDIEMHGSFGRPEHPAINVKVYRFARGLDVAKEFNCSEAQAEKALQFAYDSACQIFWEAAPLMARVIFGPDIKVWQEGRCGGWMVVAGLPDLENWNASMLGKWSRLKKWVQKEISYLANAVTIKNDIEVNQWCKDGAEQYNFFNAEDGQTICIADLKAKAIASGFGAVVRK